jgi:nitrate reductase gamma subunit
MSLKLKSALSIFSGVLLSICVSGHAHANWLVDEARWHVSAHGQMACLECHGDVTGKPHPNPAAVDRRPGAALHPDLCGGCHDSVLSEIEQGRHGGQALTPGQEYERCLACHDPHTQLRVSGAGAYDPARPPESQCGACHEPRERLPALSPADEACMQCHRAFEPGAAGADAHSRALCLACHGPEGAARGAMPAAAPAALDLTLEGFYPHREIDCRVCHPQAARYEHAAQKPGDCRSCHVRHDEALLHDAHLAVGCEACHLNQVLPRRQRETKEIGWQRLSGAPGRLHQMKLPGGEDSCRRCHYSANALGAAAMMLPAKSILCLPCHAATLGLSDATTLGALAVFALGLALSLSFWLSGAIPGVDATGYLRKSAWILVETAKALFSAKIFGIAKNFITDGLLQMKLYRHSPARWLIHGLIVWPIFLRFTWGAAALLGSLWAPGRDWPWVLLNKNHPVHGIFFDATGLMILAGAVLAVLRRAAGASARLPSLPRHDHLASGLLGAIVAVGFVLEGMRIAMTGYPPGSAYAFIGDALSRFFFGVAGLQEIYGYVWYAHALLTGVFVAYLPFSRMFHILLAPVLTAVNAADRRHAGEGG